MHTFGLAASATSNGEGSPKTPTPVDDSGAHHDLAIGVIVDDNGSDLTSAKECPKSSIPTLEPFSPSRRKNRKTDKAGKNLKILHLVNIPLECNYESLCTSVSTFGSIREIRMKFMEVNNQWEAWVAFSCNEEALQAKININTLTVCGKVVGGDLTDRLPQHLDVYRPVEWIKRPSPHQESGCDGERPPAPPMWLVARAKDEKFNFFKFSRYLQKKVGGIFSGDISRFGKAAVLIHSKSETQSRMLTLMKVDDDDLLQDVTPHFRFSYGKGVVFDEGLCEFDENEILQMCPFSVWKVKKVEKSNMIILTFNSSTVPSHVLLENVRVAVRAYKQKPVQCFKCYKFGHLSRTCTAEQLCVNCSGPEHGVCSAIAKCVNCNLAHKSTDKCCEDYKFEEAAIIKANDEHLTVGFAKKILGKSKSYARAVTPLVSASSGGLLPPVVGSEAQGSKLQPSRVAPQTAEVASVLALSEASSPTPPSVGASSPLHEQSTDVSSQVASLLHPVVNASSKAPKRGRPPSSPLSVSITPTVIKNKFEALGSDKPESRSGNNSLKVHKIDAEVHHPPQQSKKGTKIKDKPKISRPLTNKDSLKESHAKRIKHK